MRVILRSVPYSLLGMGPLREILAAVSHVTRMGESYLGGVLAIGGSGFVALRFPLPRYVLVALRHGSIPLLAPAGLCRQGRHYFPSTPATRASVSA